MIDKSDMTTIKKKKLDGREVPDTKSPLTSLNVMRTAEIPKKSPKAT